MNTFIFKEMKRYRRRFLFIVIALVAVWTIYFVANSPYILNRFLDPTHLDVSHFSKNTKTMEVGEPFELHRNDDKTIPDYGLKGSSYWKDDRYEFVVPLSSLEEVDAHISNKQTYTGGGSSPDMTSAKAWITQIGGKNVLVITYPDFEPQNATEVTGIFTSIPLVLKHDLANHFKDNPQYEVCRYMLDTRGIEMESEAFDLVFVSLLLAIILFLIYRLSRQFTDHRRTPTYKQLAKYGDIDFVEKLVEKELTDATLQGSRYICENWIVSRDTFGLKIVKNHIKHGSFKY